MEGPSRNASAGSSSSSSSTTTTPTTPPTSSSSRNGPFSGGRQPLWMGLLLLLALVFLTVATGHENAAPGVHVPVAPSTPPPPTPPQTPPPPTTTTPPIGGSGSGSGVTGGFKIFESLLGGKGSKASKEAAAAATLANEAVPSANAQEKEEEPSVAAVASEEGHAGSSESVIDAEKPNLEAAAAATASAGEIAAATPEQPSSPPPAASPAATQPPPPPPPPQQKQAEQPPPSPPKPKGQQAEVNYAAEKAGAVVLQSSSSLVGAKNLLDDDKDKYARSPCAESKWVIINLSEDIRIHALVLANYEKFSSMVKDFQVWYSVQCPSVDGEEDSEGWMELGTFQAREKAGEQRFVVDPPRYARYLKVRLVSHWSREFYCTLSQIKVLGSTLQQGFMDDWQKQKLNLGSQLEAIDPATVGDGSSSSSSNQTCLADGTCTTQEEGKQGAEGVEVELSSSSSPSSSGSTDGGDGKELKAGREGGGGAPSSPSGGEIEQSAESQTPPPQGEHTPKHEEKDDSQHPAAKEKGTVHTFAEPSVPAGTRSVETEGGRDERDSTGEAAAAAEPVVLEHVPAVEGAVGSGEKTTTTTAESDHPPPTPASKPGKDGNSSGEKEKEGAATEAAAGGEVHKEDGVQKGEKRPVPAAEPPLQGATGANGASTPPPLLPAQDPASPTPVVPPASPSEGTSAEGGEAGKNQDTQERNATADLAPAASAADSPPSPADDTTKETTTATPVLNEEGVVTPVPAAEAAPPPPPPPPPPPSGITPNPTTTATVVATVSGAPAKTELMSRFRRQCLQQMRLGDFKKQKLAKLQEDLRAKGGGAAAASSLGSGSPYDNIFKTLMDEMTSLEINQSIFDVYVSNLHSCFVQVVDDVLLEQERARLEAGETIGALQGRLQNQATVNEQLLHRMHRLENYFLVGALAWLIVLGFLVLLACVQVGAWKRLPRTTAAAAGSMEGEEQEQQVEKEKQN